MQLLYQLLSWKVHQALIRAKLEPFLGFLHSTAKRKPSLICDFMELYRYVVDDFLILYCRNLKKENFVVKTESLSNRKNGKRKYLDEHHTSSMAKTLNEYFLKKVEIPRIRYGTSQEIETLMNEEALLLAKYLRSESQSWIPRIASLIQ